MALAVERLAKGRLNLGFDASLVFDVLVTHIVAELFNLLSDLFLFLSFFVIRVLLVDDISLVLFEQLVE